MLPQTLDYGTNIQEIVGWILIINLILIHTSYTFGFSTNNGFLKLYYCCEIIPRHDESNDYKRRSLIDFSNHVVDRQTDGLT